MYAKTDMTRLEMMLAGGNVRRFHANPVLKERTVGHHTFNMLVLADNLYDGASPPRLMRAILYHDLHEGITGDVPYPTKRHSPVLYEEMQQLEWEIERRYNLVCELTTEEKQVLAALDMLEFLLYLIQEQQLGNQNNVRELTYALKTCEGVELPPHLTPGWRALLDEVLR